MAIYTAVVSLMHDLEQHLSSYDRIFGRSSELGFCPFTKKEMEILYNTVSLMDSLLRDSWGQSYDHKSMDQILGKQILDLARKAGNYLAFWAVQCLQDPEFIRQRIIEECPSLTEIAQQIDSMLRWLPDISKAQVSEFNSSTDMFLPFEVGKSSIKKALGDLRKHLEQLGNSNFHSHGWIFSFAEREILDLYSPVSVIDINPESLMSLRDSRNFITKISEKRILDVANKAWIFVGLLFNIVKESMLCRPHTTFTREGIISEYPALTEITQDIVSVNEELKKIRDNREVQDLEITSSTGKFSTFFSSSRSKLNTEGKLVGLEKDLITMLDGLTGHPSRLNVLSIIGMAGIGKTTLARKLYDDPLVLHHFHVCAWVTVSQHYQVREILLRVPCCVTNVPDEISEMSESDEELREQVYRILKGRKYLIVLDDMWCTKAWDELKWTFPDDKNGSRIMLTSRLKDVAVHASQDTPPYNLRCLSIHESWELLSSKILVDESYPQELVEIGKQIAYKCQGLPLALVVVGGLLSKMKKKLDLWKEVAQSVGSLVMEEAEGYQEILALSYNHLPDHLKSCFLYM